MSARPGTPREALDLYKAGRLAEAAALCERLVVDAPSVEARHILGVARLGLEQWGAALVALDAGRRWTVSDPAYCRQRPWFSADA